LKRPAARRAGGAADAYTLADLQGYLNQFAPAHYSHAGREPLLYAVVLLLSAQPRGLLAYLAHDKAAAEYRLDAVHLAVALAHHQARQQEARKAGRRWSRDRA
jgi:hypothetical protein